MKIVKNILTKNDCYKAGRTITVKGLMLHSVGCNQPSASVFLKNWNKSGVEACVHAFIDGNSGTVYQTLPWNHRGWHGGGSSNNTHIGVEMCEPSQIKYTGGASFTCSDKTAARKVAERTYKSAVELFAYLCKQYGLTEQNIICHCEGYKKGIASNHGDVMHWFPKHGKSMDTFRADVKALLSGGTSEPSTKPDTSTAIKAGDLVKITGTKYYGGQTIPGWVKNQNWYVQEVSGDRAVINKNESGTNAIMSPIRVSDLTPVSGSGSTTYRVHTVVKGDTLWGIAVKYLGNGTRYKEIKTLNGLTSDVIYSGQKLKIPN